MESWMNVSGKRRWPSNIPHRAKLEAGFFKHSGTAVRGSYLFARITYDLAILDAVAVWELLTRITAVGNELGIEKSSAHSRGFKYYFEVREAACMESAEKLVHLIF